MKKAPLMKKCEPHLLQENVKSYVNEKTLKCSLIPDVCNSEHLRYIRYQRSFTSNI